MLQTLEQLADIARQDGPKRVVLVFPHDQQALEGAAVAQRAGTVRCTLVGDEALIRSSAEASRFDLEDVEIVDAPDEERAAARAVAMCRGGEAEGLVNCGLPLGTLMSAVLDARRGLRSDSLLSGVSVLELEGWSRLLLLSDGLLIVSPDLSQRVGIVQNAVSVAHRLGTPVPKVALLAATEAVDPKSQVSVDAAQITVMAAHGQIKGAVVDGPLGFDNAISAHAAQVKGISTQVAGQVDVLIAPDLESGNLLLRTLSCLCRGRAANAIVGGCAPVVLLSPDDDLFTQVAAISLGALLA